MRVLNAKSFWTYSAIAAVAGFLVYLLVHHFWLSAEKLYPDPGYSAYVEGKGKYERWERDNEEKNWQRTFEEILAGTKPLEAAPAGQPREFAASIRSLMKGAESDPEAWSKALTGLFLSSDGKPRANAWFGCSYISDQNRNQILDTCRFNGWASVLNDPLRVTKILKGDKEAFTKVSEAPKVPAVPVAKTLTEPGWALPLRWIVASLIFAIFFCITGLIFRAADDDKVSSWGHPFRGWPNIIFGWLVMLTAAPGFIATRFLYLLVIDVTPAVNAWVKPMLSWLGAKFVSKPSFADEYEEFTAQIASMRTMAAGHPDLLAQMSDLDAKVREAQDAKKLGKLRESLNHIKSYMELTSEIEA